MSRKYNLPPLQRLYGAQKTQTSREARREAGQRGPTTTPTVPYRRHALDFGSRDFTAESWISPTEMLVVRGRLAGRMASTVEALSRQQEAMAQSIREATEFMRAYSRDVGGVDVARLRDAIRAQGPATGRMQSLPAPTRYTGRLHDSRYVEHRWGEWRGEWQLYGNIFGEGPNDPAPEVPAPPHPDAGKVINRPKRSVAGVMVEDVRNADGSVSRRPRKD